MHIGNLGQQRYIRGRRSRFAAVTEYRTTKRLPLPFERVGDTNAIGLGVVDDIDLVISQRLVQVIGASRSLVVVGRRDAEVVDHAGWTKRPEQVVLPAAARR